MQALQQLCKSAKALHTQVQFKGVRVMEEQGEPCIWSQTLSLEWTPPWCWPQSAGPPPIPQSLTASPHRMNSVLFNFHSLPQTSACCIIASRRPAYTAASWNVRHVRAQNPSESIPRSLYLRLCDNGPCCVLMGWCCLINLWHWSMVRLDGSCPRS